MQKGQSPILIVVGILVVALIGGAYYLGTQKSQTQVPVVVQTPQPSPTLTTNTESSASADTSNWKTYKSEKYHFEIKIPPDWEVSENDPNYPGIAIVFGEIADINHYGQKVTPYVGQGLWLEVESRNEEIKTLEDAENKVYNCDEKNNPRLERKNLKIDGQEVLVIKNSVCGLASTNLLMWMDNNNVYLLMTYSGIDGFLSTFKFTN